MSFSEDVKTARTQLKLSQMAFAKELNICFSSLNRWENGKIIGMVVSGRKNVLSMNYVIKIEDIIAFIKKVEEKEEIKILN